jgi:hypothetical protein
MDPDIIQLSDGRKFKVPGYGALTPDQQAQRVAQLEREARVAGAAKRLNDQEAQTGVSSMLSDTGLGGTVKSALRGIDEAGDEFARNFTGGLTELAGAGASYLNFTDEDPFEGMDFWERRDAIELAQDNEAEAYLPGWVDDTASVVGALGMGGGPALVKRVIQGPKAAATVGATVGALEGAGNSNAQNLSDLFQDALIGGGVGGAVGAGSDLLLDKVVGGTARKVFADENSASRFDELEALGIPPSVGAIGNRNAATLENAFAESPVTATLGRTMDAIPLVPGRSASGKQQLQVEALERALGDKVTSNMVAPGDAIAQTDSALAPYLRDVAQQNVDRGIKERGDLEAAFSTMVPPSTPVNISNTRRAPGEFVRGGESARLSEAAQGEVDTILRNPRKPVDTAKDAKLNTDLRKIEADIARAEGQMSALPPGDPQALRLRATVDRLNKTREKTLGLIDENKGPTWRALRQERSFIGSNLTDGSFARLSSRDDNALYSAITRDLERAAAKVGGPKARTNFRNMTRREREIYASEALIKPLTTQKGAAGNVPFLKAAIIKGNDAEYDALVSRLTPEEMGTFRANALHMLGRNTKDDPFVPSQFSGNWQRMSPEAKNKLVPDPQQRALIEAISGVSDSFTARGMASNRSNSANAAGVMAFLGAAVANPAKIIPFLATAGGIDRVVVSRAMAEAVAGRPTQLGQLVRRATMNAVASGDAMEILFGEGGQP